MKIGMLISDFWPGPQGGTEKQCERLSTELARRGHEVWVITSWPRTGVLRQEPHNGYRIMRCGLLRPFLNGVRRFRNALQTRANGTSSPETSTTTPKRKKFRWMAPLQWLDKTCFMLEAGAYIRSLHLDVLHVHESHWIAGFAAWWGHRLSIRVVCKEATLPSLPAFEPDVPWANLWQRERLRCDQYVALTARMAEDLVARGIEPNQVKVIPNGVSLFPVVPSHERDPTLVVCVANLTQGIENKGIHVLVAAWHTVIQKKPDARLIILGRGNPAQISTMTGIPYPSGIEWLGYVEDPAPYYCRASVFVLPSRLEGMSNALLEAQSWGIPAVVTSIPASLAVISDGVNGRVVAVGDADSMAEAIVDLLTNETKREHMGRAARQIIEQRFSMSQVADQWLALYSQMLANQ